MSALDFRDVPLPEGLDARVLEELHTIIAGGKGEFMCPVFQKLVDYPGAGQEFGFFLESLGILKSGAGFDDLFVDTLPKGVEGVNDAERRLSLLERIREECFDQ